MAFSWKKCKVVSNRENRKEANDCYKVIYSFKYCLTPVIIGLLCDWLSSKMRWSGINRMNALKVKSDITELLGKCCNTTKVSLLMHMDVEKVEYEIIKQIENAIKTHKENGIYTEGLVLETTQEYAERQKVNIQDIENYLMGVQIFD